MGSGPVLAGAGFSAGSGGSRWSKSRHGNEPVGSKLSWTRHGTGPPRSRWNKTCLRAPDRARLGAFSVSLGRLLGR
jgi:hypothetical protein